MKRGIALALLGAGVAALCGCAPIVPERSKPGGAARWGQALARREAIAWAPDAALCRIAGAGVGTEGWLPDAGGYWQFDFWSAGRRPVLEVTVDSDGRTRSSEIADSPCREQTLPGDWSDSPKVWAATRSHQRSEPLSTFDAELARETEPQRFPGRVVWRIRFYLPDKSRETHVLTPEGRWLVSY